MTQILEPLLGLELFGTVVLARVVLFGLRGSRNIGKFRRGRSRLIPRRAADALVNLGRRT